MNPTVLSSLIRNKLPDAVVRDDSCDVVRVQWQGRSAYAEPLPNVGFHILISLRALPESSESVPTPQLLDYGADESEAADKIAYWLKRVAAVALDRH